MPLEASLLSTVSVNGDRGNVTQVSVLKYGRINITKEQTIMSSMLRKHRHHKRSHGVGLVDVLIAVVIISGGLVAMGRLQGASATSSAVASQQSEA